MPNDDNRILYITILFGVLTTMAAGFPLAFENSSSSTKVSAGIGLLVVGSIAVVYFLYKVQLQNYRSVIHDKQHVNLEIIKLILLYFGLSFFAEFIIYVVVGQYIPDKTIALSIGAYGFLALYLSSHRAVSVAASEKGIYVYEEWIFHFLIDQYQNNSKVKSTVHIYFISFGIFIMFLAATMMFLTSIITPNDINTLNNYHNPGLTFTLIIIASIAISFFLSSRFSINSWKKYRGGIEKLPTLIENIRVCLFPLILYYIMLIIVFGIICLLSWISISTPQSVDYLTISKGLIALFLSMLVSFITASYMVIKKWIKMDSIKYVTKISLTHLPELKK